MKSCMDKVYYPLSPIYTKMRAEEKKKTQLLKDTKNLLGKETKVISEEDLKKQQELTASIVARTEEEIAEQELKMQKEIANKQLEDYMYKIHGQFINEDDFCEDPQATEEQRKQAY